MAVAGAEMLAQMIAELLAEVERLEGDLKREQWEHSTWKQTAVDRAYQRDTFEHERNEAQRERNDALAALAEKRAAEAELREALSRIVDSYGVPIGDAALGHAALAKHGSGT